jgi:hypothetical protein
MTGISGVIVPKPATTITCGQSADYAGITGGSDETGMESAVADIAVSYPLSTGSECRGLPRTAMVRWRGDNVAATGIMTAGRARG